PEPPAPPRSTSASRATGPGWTGTTTASPASSTNCIDTEPSLLLTFVATQTREGSDARRGRTVHRARPGGRAAAGRDGIPASCRAAAGRPGRGGRPARAVPRAGGPGRPAVPGGGGR